LHEQHRGQPAGRAVRLRDDRAQPRAIARQQLAVFSIQSGMRFGGLRTRRVQRDERQASQQGSKSH
jgi:hypothetical protein